MKKNMFIAYIAEIDDCFIGTLCEGSLSEKRFAEDDFGNYCVIDKNGCIIAYMLDYEKEEYQIAKTLEEFKENYPLYNIEEVSVILDEKYKAKESVKPHNIIIELYKAKAIIGKDFIDLKFVVDGNKYDATAAYNNGKITEEEFNKIKVFYPSYLKEANKINNEKKLKNQK